MDKAPVNVPSGHEAMANASRLSGDGQPSGTVSPGEANTESLQRSVTPSSPPAIPDYELLRRIGGGSYGEVWLARSATGVLRALKIVWRHTFEDDRPVQREFEGIQRF